MEASGENGELDSPLISIVMSVRNCESQLPEALESIRAQTYENWELIVCDDASTDSTLEVLAQFSELIGAERIKVLENVENKKLAYSLNRCLEHVRGDFVARMDGDDRSVPTRLASQLQFLMNNPDIDLVGTAMRRFNSDGAGEVVYPAAIAPDRWTLGRTSKTPFFHATVMARRSVFDSVGGYTVSWRTERGQDLDLWFKFFAAGLQGRNMPDPLYWVREDAAAIRRRTARVRLGGYVTRVKGNWALGYPVGAYLRCTVDLLKIFVPYKAFDLHRRWSREAALRSGERGPTA